jgi:hypothetical protein
VIATVLKLFTPAVWPNDHLFDRAKAANTFDSILDLNMAPNDASPQFPAPVYGGVIQGVQAVAALAAPLSDLQKEALIQARTLNATLPVDFQVSAPRGLNKAAVAGKFIKSVGNAAVSAHKDLKV